MIGGLWGDVHTHLVLIYSVITLISSLPLFTLSPLFPRSPRSSPLLQSRGRVSRLTVLKLVKIQSVARWTQISFQFFFAPQSVHFLVLFAIDRIWRCRKARFVPLLAGQVLGDRPYTNSCSRPQHHTFRPLRAHMARFPADSTRAKPDHLCLGVSVWFVRLYITSS